MSCNTSRWASNGLFFQASMRQYRMRARDDMAGLSKLIVTSKIKKNGDFEDLK
jgi:hypothetical protein